MAFAVTGAFKAIVHKSDIVVIIILSTITGVAGGIIRDITLGRIPPNAVVNPCICKRAVRFYKFYWHYIFFCDAF
jgi:uncharacterized membrane protein YeiH